MSCDHDSDYRSRAGCSICFRSENTKLKEEAAKWKALCQERGPIVPIIREIEEVKADRDRLKQEVERLRERTKETDNLLFELREFVEGFCDGAPDAPPSAKAANILVAEISVALEKEKP